MKLGETSLYERKTNVRILFNLLVLTLTLFPVRLSPSQKKKRDTLIFMRKDLPTNEEEYSGLPVAIPNTQLIHHPSPSPSSRRPSSPGKIKITMYRLFYSMKNTFVLVNLPVFNRLWVK